jgi:hypothetical protein
MSKYEKMILNVATRILSTLLGATGYSRKEKQPAANMSGTCIPDLASIRQHECPEWFRDAKVRNVYEKHAVPQQGKTYFINTQLKFRLYEEVK